MGYINDIVIADSGEIQKVADSSNPLNHWPGAEDVGLEDDLMLARLYCLLTGTDDVEEVVVKLSQRYAESTIDPTAYANVISEELTNLLAQLEPDRLEELAATWTESEEVRDKGRSRQDVRQTLDTLRTLARRALSENKVLISWVTE